MIKESGNIFLLWKSQKGLSLIYHMSCGCGRMRNIQMFEIRSCDNYSAAKELILEYSKIKGAEECFVSLDKELADLKGFYQDGALLLGYDESMPVATIAIKRIDDNAAEAKRLYIKHEYRGQGYARLMLNAMLDKCRELGFKEVRFTTKPEVMSIGYALYKRMGFEELKNDQGTALMRMILH